MNDIFRPCQSIKRSLWQSWRSKCESFHSLLHNWAAIHTYLVTRCIITILAVHANSSPINLCSMHCVVQKTMYLWVWVFTKFLKTLTSPAKTKSERDEDCGICLKHLQLTLTKGWTSSCFEQAATPFPTVPSSHQIPGSVQAHRRNPTEQMWQWVG